MKWRFEEFGAIIATDEPPALVWIDQDMARGLGFGDSPLWNRQRGELSAPTEVHVMTTERCPAGCPSCYVGSTMQSPEPTEAELRHTFQKLADAGVFHVALGGGESLLRDDLFGLAAWARELGMVPNLTTSGIGMNEEKAEQCQVFGQVNVSLDGLGDVYQASRGYDGAGKALAAIRMLSQAGVSVGINLVLQRHTFEALDETVAAAIEAGASEVEMLRFKPAGRAHATYLAMRLDAGQRQRLLPEVLRLMKRWPKVNIKVDCSLVPFLCAGDPDPALLETFGVVGCEAGHMLAAVRADGRATACSFLEQDVGGVDGLVDGWETSEELLRWRRYHLTAAEPCASCPYRAVCKGGCRAVVTAYSSSPFEPDPECPRVVAWRRGQLHP